MGRPRAFDEGEAIRAAASLFADRAYDGVSVDDLVVHLGVHRNSLYKVFGSKRGLYLAALRWHLEHQVRPVAATIAAAPDPARALRDAFSAIDGDPDLDLLLLALVERAPVDAEVAAEVDRGMRDLDAAAAVAIGGDTPAGSAYTLVATLLGLRMRARAGAGTAGAGTSLLDRIHRT
ncbi:TetR/AcrR family transcriptional repressor of nem operon [Allocatelliglobosispora scoriae]|uniref:TetR/AcrR family transcriptional repressor of nem operon n=1 Tax=Allocatelliglobosispora scoriae TaxID=643052 RepID=A0A841C3D9_9ACTN|nr:TetR/AcrR family transcriptional regulator [Allocatelliglobosispora scoriae]MBB5874426.1 TetR/AcrR family transcriptional repressor of nem operon [Allocatelliglobosispora scoriae]